MRNSLVTETMGNLTLTQYTLTEQFTIEKLEIFGVLHQGPTCVFWFNEIITHAHIPSGVA